MIFNCPGSQKFKEPQPEDITCPHCGKEVEIWTDEFQAACPKCGKIVRKDEAQSCLDWCKYAKECVGGQAYDDYAKNKAVKMKEKLIMELEAYFGKDARRINHAKKVMDYAEELLPKEGGDWHIVIPTAILHDVGIKISEEKYGSSAGRYQEIEGPAIAEGILIRMGFKKDEIGEICRIIAHHHSPGKINTRNFNILYDADWLVNLEEEVDTKDKGEVARIIAKVFLTGSAKEIARQTYL